MPQVVLGVVVWGFVVVQLTLTLATQRPGRAWLRRLKYRDVAALIPSWTFFAPNPGTNDTRIFWRERRHDGGVSVWHEVLPPATGWLRAVWNPWKRSSKALTDAGAMLLRMVSDRPESPLPMISVPYLLILHSITTGHVSALTESRQFLVVHSAGADPAVGSFRPLLLSRWHPVAA